jgi:uncharacterized Zn finger protein
MSEINEYCTHCQETASHSVVTDSHDSDIDIVTCKQCGTTHGHSLYISCGG